MMLTEFGQKLTPDRRQKIAPGGHAIHQVLTVASIVEREAQVPDERAGIAGVFYNRLATGCRCRPTRPRSMRWAGPATGGRCCG